MTPNRFRNNSLLAMIALLLVALAACKGTIAPNSGEKAATVASVAEAVASVAEAHTIIDREGNTITRPTTVGKIISTSPAVTETLVHLGLGDTLVATDLYSAGIVGIPEGLPTFDMLAPDAERIVMLRPDIVFVTGMTKEAGEDPFAAIADLGTTIVYIPIATTIADIKEDIRFIGAVTGTPEQASTIVTEMEAEIEEVLAAIGTEEAVQSVYFEIAAAPSMYSFGSGTFLNEIIELLGAKNILADQESWVAVSEEVVLGENPAVIITNVTYIEAPVEEIISREGWDVVSAVKEQRVYQIDGDASARPNEYITGTVRELAQALYPALFVRNE